MVMVKQINVACSKKKKTTVFFNEKFDTVKKKKIALVENSLVYPARIII